MAVNEPLRKDDYEEPSCLICDPMTGERKNMQSIPLQRITEKADEYCDLKDFAGAERHLKYWLLEAESLGDSRGRFSLYNEMMGFYRKQGRKEEAMECAGAALDLMEKLNLTYTVSGGTCYVNCGTVYDSFGEPEKALEYFRKGEEVLNSCEFKDYFKIGSLYNNMALSLMDLSRFTEANAYYLKALEVMKKVPGAELEQAITYLNMADAVASEKGLEGAETEINEYVRTAYDLLNSEVPPRDGYYAFVCEKCAPGFYCYGFDEWGEEIDRRSAQIYEEIKENERS